jgi:phage terminase small subunit
MGRCAKPVQILLDEGNARHLTKQEIADRRAAEIKIEGGDLRCPAFVKEDPVAFKRWKELKKLFRGFTLVAEADSGCVARYCKTWSEYLSLLSRRARIAEMDYPETDQAIEDEVEEHEGKKRSIKFWKKMEYIMSTPGLLAIDTAINAKLAELDRLDDRLFLNPLAKIRNVPRKKQEEEKGAFDL